jgi:hypothetical protein
MGIYWQKGDFTVYRLSGLICPFIRKAKGNQQRNEAAKSVLPIPIEVNPLLADLLDYYLVNRADVCANHYNYPPPTHIWSFLSVEHSAGGQATTTLSAWLELEYSAVHASPPAGFKPLQRGNFRC